MTVTHYSTGPDPFIVDLNWYSALPDDLKKIFDTVARETMLYSDKLNRVAEQEMITKLEDELEVNYLSSEELQPFQVLAASVHEHFIEQGTISSAEIQRARRIASGQEQ